MNFGACSHNLADNHGVALTLELMYGANDVCDKVGHVYMYLEGEQGPVSLRLMSSRSEDFLAHTQK